ncbi:hypothetical protein BAAM0483_02500 [Bifidobacterium animalis subsp. animalis MCC 0483]|uniref:Uncharacterized protein n=1 Tax=Bifidobacterium animalis subsp. animalis MCC 0483 TaxID=1365955 RepID=A0AB34TAM8_9BIFI|nr:hypothetical protein BAAM0483_02500 [Bifidobacterium animalis subsp. animalis MCC 0483]KOA56633.1 hypothetical protein BAAA27672_00800 [Bifidobacterium animalis subsp. animalis ATCC 27672]
MPSLLDAALLDEPHPDSASSAAAVADLQATPRVLLDDDHGDAGPVHLTHANEGLVLHHRREARAWLVEQQHTRLHHQRAPHRHHLPLAAGELACQLVPAVAELGEDRADVVEALVEQLRRLICAHMHVLGDREAREHVLRLWHEADAPRDEFVGTQIHDVLPFERELAGVDVHEAEQRLEQRGLAGAVRADEGRDAMALDLEMLHIHGRNAAEATGDVIGHQNRVGLVHAGLVLHVAQVFGHLVAVGGGDELLPLRRLRGPFRDVVERFLHGGRRAGSRGLACLVGCVSH